MNPQEKPIGRFRKSTKIEQEIDAQTVNLLSQLEYWKQRCLLAEKIIEESPCDPDITTEQIQAHRDYHNFLKENGNG